MTREGAVRRDSQDKAAVGTSMRPGHEHPGMYLTSSPLRSERGSFNEAGRERPERFKDAMTVKTGFVLQ
jgi:hypothetical protein